MFLVFISATILHFSFGVAFLSIELLSLLPSEAVYLLWAYQDSNLLHFVKVSHPWLISFCKSMHLNFQSAKISTASEIFPNTD